MQITTAALEKTEVSISKFPDDGLFEVVLIGKSNVGKSSFINSLTNMKNMARTSSQPGKTRTANFYLINESFRIVDMPGYGYAKVSKSIKEQFSQIIRQYLEKRETDFAVMFLIDHRHTPTDNDLRMYEMLNSYGICPAFVLTKTDKVKNSEKSALLKNIKNAFSLTEDDFIVEYSSETGEGKQKILTFLSQLVEE